MIEFCVDRIFNNITGIATDRLRSENKIGTYGEACGSDVSNFEVFVDLQSTTPTKAKVTRTVCGTDSKQVDADGQLFWPYLSSLVLAADPNCPIQLQQ